MTRMERRRRRRRILRIKLATTAAVLALTTASIVALTGGAAETTPEPTPQPPTMQAEPVLLVAEHDSTYQPVQMTAEPVQEPEPVEEEDENEKIEAALLEQGYENLVTLEYRRQCRDFKFPKDTPLDVRITAYYGIPKSVSKKKAQLMRERKIRPMKKPDFDNIGKIVCDSLNNIAYHDDAQIVDAQVRKFFSDDPRVVVTIQEAE